MKTVRDFYFCLLLFGVAAGALAQDAPPTLRGTVTDPSGALVPGATVQMRGPGGDRHAAIDSLGHYTIDALRPGKYTVRAGAKGFAIFEHLDLDIAAPVTLDIQLAIQAEAQTLNVDDDLSKVTADASNNGGAIVLRDKQIEALSDDPDVLSQQLQAMAGPGAGPNGGQIYIDGFTGGNLPNKSSIPEIRINSNPFSPEYERPGFGRIEIFTRPGTDTFHGSASFQYNKEALNSRSPLLTQSKRPPYKQDMIGFNLSGPVKKNKASFGFDANRRGTTENAFVLATTHRRGPAGKFLPAAQHKLSGGARHTRAAVAQHQHADRRPVSIWRLADPHPDRIERLQPDAPAHGKPDGELQEAVPVRLLRALLREERRRGAAGRPIQPAIGMGSFGICRRAASSAGVVPAAAAAVERKPVHRDLQRIAV